MCQMLFGRHSSGEEWRDSLALGALNQCEELHTEGVHGDIHTGLPKVILFSHLGFPAARKAPAAFCVQRWLRQSRTHMIFHKRI